MSDHRIIVVGASAGGVEMLVKLVRDLPADFPGALFIVLHIPAESPSLLPAILQRAGPLLALHPADEAKIERGHIYIAPPDQHLLIEHDHVRVIHGPKENRHRPAVDPLFRSAARYYGPQVIGIVLSGALDDGTAGLLAIKRQGGIAIVQDPKEAIYSGMPQSALEHVSVDYCLPVVEITALLKQLAREPVAQQKRNEAPTDMRTEVKVAAMETNSTSTNEQIGQPSAFSCPECGGVLWEIHDDNLVRFRCRTGHAFSTESVLAEQSEALERSLWFALKTVDEQVSLLGRLARQANENGRAWLANNFSSRMHEAEQHAASLRMLLEHPIKREDPLAAMEGEPEQHRVED